jgi:hypothetical protein
MSALPHVSYPNHRISMKLGIWGGGVYIKNCRADVILVRMETEIEFNFFFQKKSQCKKKLSLTTKYKYS